jgi:hypothetical protein
MYTTGMSFKAIGRQKGYHYTVVSRRLLTVLVDRRLLGSQWCLSTGLVANCIRLTKRCNALSSRSDVIRGLPDLGKPVSASCNRRPDEGLETHKYSLYPTEHPANCPLRWSSVMVLGCISHDCKLDLVTIQATSH